MAPLSSLAGGQPPFYAPLTLATIEPIVYKIKVPPFVEPIHRERTATLVVPQYTVVESSARSMGTIPTYLGGNGGDTRRPFTLKNLEALGNFLGRDSQP